MIDRIPLFGTLKDLPMNSSNSSENQKLPPQCDDVDIPCIRFFVTASDTGQQRPNQIPGGPEEFYTSTVSNVSEWSVSETLTEAGTLSTVGIEKTSFKGLGVIHQQQKPIWRLQRGL